MLASIDFFGLYCETYPDNCLAVNLYSENANTLSGNIKDNLSFIVDFAAPDSPIDNKFIDGFISWIISLCPLLYCIIIFLFVAVARDIRCDAIA